MADFSSPLIPAALPRHGGGSINMAVVAGDRVNPGCAVADSGSEVSRSMSGRIEEFYLQECSMLYCVLSINRGN